MIRWFAAHPTAANLLLVLIVIAGLLAAPMLKRETFPEYRPKEAGVEVEYRGATAADVEDAICRRLTEALNALDNLEELSCIAQNNLASATAEMSEGGDFGRFLDDVQTEVAAIDDLPARAETPVVRERHRNDLVAAVAVSGAMSDGDLKTYAEALKDRLLALPGVADVGLKGFSQRRFQIEAPMEVLRQHGLSAEELAGLLARQNVDLPGGSIETEDQDVLIRFVDERRSTEELASLIVLAGEGRGELTLGEIADIRDGFEKPEDKILFDGARAAVLEVSKPRAADALDVLDRVQEAVEAERARLPDTVRLAVTQDMTTIVRDRLEMMVENAVMGAVLVLLVMSAFFRPRFALWAAMGLPVAFFGAFAAMALFGLSINMVTLVALLMAVGIVMDDAVVITDNIASHALEGKTSLTAVVEGTRQVVPGVLSSFLTTVAVFAPLSFLAGEIGSVLEVLPVVLIAALAVSLIEAFLVLPHHLKGAVTGFATQKPSRLRARFDHGFEWTRETIVGGAADRAVRHRYLVAGLMVFVLVGSAGYLAGGHIGREAMPDIDGEVLEARILMPQGTPLTRTEDVVERVTAGMDAVNTALTPEQPGGESLVKSIQVRFNENATARETGPHVATVIVDLLSAETRSTTLDEIVEQWRAEVGDVPGLIDLTLQEPGLGPQGIPIEIRIKGSDLDALKAASNDLRRALASYTGVYNISDDLRPGKPERRLSLAEGAHSLGLTAEAVAGQLRSAFLGNVATTIQIERESYEITVRQPLADRNSLDDLHDFAVTLPDGSQVPLSVAADIETGRGWARIARIDGERTASVLADVDTRRANAEAIVADVEASVLPDIRAANPNIRFEVEGQTAKSQETSASILRGFMIGLVGIFVVLAFQFRSYIEPVIVMIAIPLAFLGALWGHVIMGYSVSMPSLVGTASLAGIVVNNSILLVQFIKNNLAAGMDVAAAAGQAARQRFRAIFVSSTTTIAGLLPLLAETSTQAQVLKPLVIAVVFGLLASTVLVLFVIPCLYAILTDLRPSGTTPEHQSDG